MGIKNWVAAVFGSKATEVDIDTLIGELAIEACFKKLAIQSCINLISNVLSKAEFKTYEQGKEVRQENYYLFNVQPNKNKSASKFWRDVIYKLVYDNECLVVMQDRELYVADSFQCEKYAFKEYIYRGVVVDELQLNRSYRESEVFHFEMHNERIRNVIDNLYQNYGKLIAAAQKNYKRNNSPRGTVEVSTSYAKTEKAQQELKELFGRKFKDFFEAEGPAILPLTEGVKYNELSSNIGSRTENYKEIRSFIDDVFDFVAIAFNIPPQLLKGSVAITEGLMDNFMTFCINPFAKLLQDEINRKYYGKDAFLKRTYLRIDTSMIRAHDLKDIAGALETLLRIGGYTIDDILTTLGKEPLNTEWSQIHWMTKNYSPVEDFLKEGGEIE